MSRALGESAKCRKPGFSPSSSRGGSKVPAHPPRGLTESSAAAVLMESRGLL